MAPKGGGGRGGGGRSGGGGSACPQCTAPLELLGSEWTNTLVLAIFAVYVIVALVLLCCIVLQTRFKWVRESLVLDRLRNKGFYYAAGSLLIMYILQITDLALKEESHTTTRLYTLMYIFIDLFFRIADLLILAIIFRCIAVSSTNNLARKLQKLHKFTIIILGLLSCAAFALYVTRVVHQLVVSGYSVQVLKTFEYLETTYTAIYLCAALLAGFESVTLFLRSRSKQATILLLVVAPSLVLHALFALILAATSMYFTNRLLRYDNWSLRMAGTFIVELTNIGIYLGVVMAGWVEFRIGGGKRGHYAHAGNGGRQVI